MYFNVNQTVEIEEKFSSTFSLRQESSLNTNYIDPGSKTLFLISGSAKCNKSG